MFWRHLMFGGCTYLYYNTKPYLCRQKKENPAGNAERGVGLAPDLEVKQQEFVTKTESLREPSPLFRCTTLLLSWFLPQPTP